MPRREIVSTGLPGSVFREIAEMVRDGRAEIVKVNPQRTIYRVHVGGASLHVKHCRVNGWRAWLREWLRAPKARLEFRNLHRAAERGVPTVLPLDCAVSGSRRPGDSLLITRTIVGAVPLNAWLESGGPACAPGARCLLAKVLGHFLARVHHAGVLHPDLHPGNILLRWRDGRPELFLLDLHDTRIGRPASRRQALANLAVFNRWFILRSARTDRLRFWHEYVAERNRLTGRAIVSEADAAELEMRTRRSNFRFWRSLAGRCLGSNRRFRRVSTACVRGHAVREWTSSELELLLSNPAALLESIDATVLKHSRSSTVVTTEVTINGERRHVVVKRFRTSFLRERLAGLFRPCACRRSWINGHAFVDCLLPTARPLAVFNHCHRGTARDGFLITEYIPDATDLRQAAEQGATRDRIHLVARLVRDLHERGWSHRDLKANNILIAPDKAGQEAAWLIDLVGASRVRRLTRGRRVKDLARLNASFHDLPRLSRTARLRFLLMYLNCNLHGAGDWKSWWTQIDRRTRDKVARNRKRGRVLA